MNKLHLNFIILSAIFVGLLSFVFSNRAKLNTVENWEYCWSQSDIFSKNSLFDLSNKWQIVESLNKLSGKKSHYLFLRTKVDTKYMQNSVMVVDRLFTSIQAYNNQLLIYSFGAMNQEEYQFLGEKKHFIDISNIKNEYVYLAIFSPGKQIGIKSKVYYGTKSDVLLSNVLLRNVDVYFLFPLLLGMGFVFLMINLYKELRSLKFISLGVFLFNLAVFTILKTSNSSIIFKNALLMTNIKYFAMFIFPFTLQFFACKNFDFKVTKASYIVAFADIVFTFAALILTNLEVFLISDFYLPYAVLFALTFIFIFKKIFSETDIKLPEIRLWLIGVVILLIFQFHDLLIYLNVINSDKEKLEWGTFLFAMCLIVITKNRLADMYGRLKIANEKLQHYSTDLKEEVGKRTFELKQRNIEIQQAYQRLEISKRIQDSDIKMARNIQRKFFLAKPPQGGNWQIAYRFMPVYDVSGDIYDFYLDENDDLKGVVLFDVSGHGVSSGLISIAAKILSFHKFRDMSDHSVAEVMYSVNEDISGYLENVENYLTGVMMRFSSNSIEYVNCAHSEVLVKRKSTGKVEIAAPDTDSYKGPIMGYSEHVSKLQPITFEVDKGDLILLFTDCMYEERNKEGKFFGVKNLISAFESLDEDDPEKVTDQLIDIVRNYSHGSKLHDDLTLICIKKLTK